ncbi:MAG: SPOR domain-containing protein [Prevotellaceae bacterium]|nr:SPOR domain-containing protein [Prevotellaceae bacterium]
MKKIFVMGASLAVMCAMTACHSSESAYKKAYEKAQAAQTAEEAQAAQVTQTAEVAAVGPTTTQTVTPTTDYSNVSVRSEDVSLVNGAGLKAYSVVVGSFGMLSNAQGLQSTLQGRGYGAQIVQATVNGSPFYRVVATTFDTKEAAVQSRANLMQEFRDAWLLYQK